ncbi:hypothetical protein HZA76_00180 [Candidatus Roizmanbacteria bacterium]|nr:hypothetical protein [Candidatus Roizmanbacteria bacterium]
MAQPDGRILLDLRIRETWTEQNAPLIARQLGYIFNPRFLEVYTQFLINTVQAARLPNLLGSIAQGEFSQVKPPLETLPLPKVEKKI